METIKITVETAFENENTGEMENKSLVIEQAFDGHITEMTEIFRSILYWMTFTAGTIDDVVKDKETIDNELGARLGISNDESFGL